MSVPVKNSRSLKSVVSLIISISLVFTATLIYMSQFTIISCHPWKTFYNWTNRRPLSLVVTWMLIIRSGSNLWVPLIVMVLQHLISLICLAVHNSSMSQCISFVIAWTCCLLMFQVWLILILVILTILIFYFLWKWVLKFPILLSLIRCIWNHSSIGLMLVRISVIPIRVWFIIVQIQCLSPIRL